MTTVEKLFVQIFERKKWIIEQVKQQTDLYDQQLASKLLINGITPPSWLWNSKFQSDSSDHKVLKKEELISELLLPHPRPTVPYSSGQHSLYNKPVFTGDNGDLSDGLFMETHASNKGFDAGDGHVTMPECHVIDIGCTLNCVTELDCSVTSPQEQKDAGISNIYTTSGQSFSRIQRSKYRQKVLKLRNSAKAVSKSSLSHENSTGISSSRFATSSQQPDHANEFMELAKLSDISSDSCKVREMKGDCLSKGKGTNVYCGRITRSRSSSIEFTTSRIVPQQRDRVNEFLELVNPSDFSRDSSIVSEAKRDCPSNKMVTNIYHGRIMRSRSSCKQHSFVNDFFERIALLSLPRKMIVERPAHKVLLAKKEYQSL